MIVIVLIFQLIKFSKNQCTNFLIDTTNCYSCGFGYYSNSLTFQDFLGRVTQSTCTKITNTANYSSVVYISAASSTCDPNCDGTTDKPYSSIISAISIQWTKAMPYPFANLEFRLMSGVHYILESQLGSPKVKQYFRSLKANIIIRPCRTSEFSSCYADGASAQIIMKTDLVYFFIGYSMLISDTVITFQDIWSTTTSCRSSTTQCCSDTSMNSTDSACNLFQRNVAYQSTREDTSAALFNLEQIIDDPTPGIPTLNLTNVQILNMYSVDGQSGYLSVFMYRDLSFNLNVNSLTVTSLLLQHGILHSKITLSKFFLYFNSTLYASIVSTSTDTVNFNGFSLSQFNKFQSVTTISELFKFRDQSKSITFNSFSITNCLQNNAAIFQFLFSITNAALLKTFAINFNQINIINNNLLNVFSLTSNDPSISVFASFSNLISNGNSYSNLFLSSKFQVNITLLNVQNEVYLQSIIQFQNSVVFVKNSTFQNLLKSSSNFAVIYIPTTYAQTAENIVETSLNAAANVSNDQLFIHFSLFQNITTQIVKTVHTILYWEIRNSDFLNIKSNADCFSVLASENSFVASNSHFINIDTANNSIFYVWWNHGTFIQNCGFNQVSGQYILKSESVFMPTYWVNLTQTSIINSRFDSVMILDGYYLGNSFNNYISNIVLRNNTPAKISASAFGFVINGAIMILNDIQMYMNNDFSLISIFSYVDVVVLNFTQIFIRTTNTLSQGMFDISAPQTQNLAIIGLFIEVSPKLTFDRLVNLKKCVNIVIKNSVFRDIFSNQGVLISFEALSLTSFLIKDNIFINIQGVNQPAVFVISTDNIVPISYNNFESIPSSNSNNQYGIINAYFLKSDYSYFLQVMTSSQLYLKNVTFINGIGGVIDMQSSAQVVVESCNITGTLNKIANGGVFNLASLSQIAIFSSFITNSSSTVRGGVIFAQDAFIGIKGTNINISQSGSGGVLYSEKTVIQIKDSNFDTSKVTTRGGFLIVKEGSLSAVNSNFFKGISSFEASGIYTFLANVTFSGILFQNCISSNGDGTLYLIENPTVLNQLTNVTCKGNQAANGACILAYNIQLQFSQFSIDSNIATTSTIVEIFSVKGTLNLNMSGLNFTSNSAKIGLSFRDVVLSISGFNMSNNQIQSVSPIQISESQANISNMTFSNNLRVTSVFTPIFQIDNTQFSFSFSSLNFGFNFMFVTCSFCYNSSFNTITLNNGYATSNKAMIDLSDSNFLISNSIFQGNGGSDNSQLLKLSTTKLGISNTSFVQNNFSSISVLLQSSANSFSEGIYLNISNLVASGNNVSKIISTNNLILTSLSGLSFRGNVSFIQDSISLLNCQSSSLTSSSFENFNGASTVSISNTNSNFTNFMLQNTNFRNCKGSSSGGCLSVVGNINGLMQQSTFINGSSAQDGGAFYYSCVPNTCNFTVDSSNTFVDNYAANSGWAIKSASQTIKTSGVINISMTNTPTSLYTPIAGKYSKAYMVLGIDNKTQLINVAKGLDKNVTKYGIDLSQNASNILINTTSGAKLIIAFFYQDDYNNFMSFESTTLLKIDTISSVDNITNSNTSIVFENNVVQNSDNIFIFENFTIVAVPGNNYTVKVILKTSVEETFFTISFSLRRCIKGEIYLNYKCLRCDSNYYSLDLDPMKNSISKCKACPNSQAVCLGGDLILPQNNFWRFNNDSDLFFFCPLQNCNSPSDDYVKKVSTNIMAVCDNGYTGNLCVDCSVGHGKFDSRQCLECTSFLSNFGKAFVVIGFTIVLTYQIYSTFNEEEISQKQTPFIKIMVNHLTYMSLLSNYQLGIPMDFLSFLSQVTNYMPTSPQAAMTFDCLLGKDGLKKETFIAIKLILVLFLPFIYSFVCSLLKLFIDWIIPKLVKNKRLARIIGGEKKKSFRTKFFMTFVSALIVLFYNMYPQLLTVFISLVGCQQLQGTTDAGLTGAYYLENFPSVECLTGEHRNLLLIVVLPDLLIWCIGTPFFFLIISKIANRREQSSHNELSAGGFEALIFKYFVFDYKSSYYFWESFSFLRKFVIVLLAFLMRNLEPISQGGLLVFTFFVFLYVHENCHPYKEDLPNYFEAFSFIICIATTSLIILISNGNSQGSTQTVFDVKSVLLIILMGIFNLVFYGSWGFIMIKLYWSDYKSILSKITAVTLKKKSLIRKSEKKSVKKSAIAPKENSSQFKPGTMVKKTT